MTKQEMVRAINDLFSKVAAVAEREGSPLWRALLREAEISEKEHRQFMRAGGLGVTSRKWTVPMAVRYFAAKHVRDWMLASEDERARWLRIPRRPDVVLGYRLAQDLEPELRAAITADDWALWGDESDGVDYVALAEREED